MAFICITKTEEGFCAAKRLIRFFANSKIYEIIEENHEHYIVTPSKKIKIRGLTINVILFFVAIRYVIVFIQIYVNIIVTLL